MHLPSRATREHYRIPKHKPEADPVIVWVLPPLSNSWIIIILWLYIALNRTPNIDCYGYGGGGSTQVIVLVQVCGHLQSSLIVIMDFRESVAFGVSC